MNSLDKLKKARLVHNTVKKIHYSSAWWVEITTVKPFCIYYFGPFETRQEAVLSEYGYIEDLLTEKASGITTKIKQCQPELLTISEEQYPNLEKIITTLKA